MDYQAIYDMVKDAYYSGVRSDFWLSPSHGQSQKSFYRKASVRHSDLPDGSAVDILHSYDTDIMARYISPDGRIQYYPFFDAGRGDILTATTLRHIKAFSGLDKAGYRKLCALYD